MRPARWTAAFAVAALSIPLTVGFAAPATAASLDSGGVPPSTVAGLANLAHLDSLLDTATPAPVENHTTYNLDAEPDLLVPWTYADARDDGTFARVGGGPLDPTTGYWGQGAYNADDVTRAAVVYIRHWQQTGSDASRDKAYELLRSVAYFQTSSGPDAGNVVLWMQPDGTFNPSPEPVELPDPSDSAESYWLARTLWALGEGYAAFAASDPEFAAFLQDRLQLSVGALDRQVLGDYGRYEIADGVRVPAWLIANGADASAEAVLGLAAYSAAAPDDATTRSALTKLAEGIAQMGSGNTRTWPYGAILPWAESRSMYHSWSSQMPAALANASTVLGRADLLAPAVTDSATFTPTLLTAGGPDNAWYPTPTEKVQIAYGADSRLQSLLAVADATQKPAFAELAGMMGAWYFGMNRANAPIYDPETGVTFDGVQADGTVNRNSGAESTIHGLLSMIALDAHPDVAARAQAATSVLLQDGLTTVEAETAATTTGAVTTPTSAWTGESQFGGGAYLELEKGETATIKLPAGSGLRHVEQVVYQPAPGTARSTWTSGKLPLGTLKHAVGAQGITAAPGALLPQTLALPVGGSPSAVTVRSLAGTVQLDAVIVRPLISRLVLGGAAARTELVQSTSALPLPSKIGTAGTTSVVHVYDSRGALVRERTVTGATSIILPAGGFAVATG